MLKNHTNSSPEVNQLAVSALSLANEATQTLGLIACDESNFQGAAAKLRHALAIVQSGFGALLTGQCRLDLAGVLFAVDIANAALACAA